METIKTTKSLTRLASNWFASKGWKPFPYQKKAWKAYLEGMHGIVNAPTGSGKTYSLFIPIALEALAAQAAGEKVTGLQAIWITPIRALAKEIKAATQRAAEGLGLDWNIAIRSGDTPEKERRKLRQQAPHVLITTPESLHLLMASRGYPDYFKHLKTVVTDEWHELIGSKRGVQMELALSRLKGFLPKLKVWGISATIGNMDEALEVLLGSSMAAGKHCIIRSSIQKKIAVSSVIPKEIERFPWAGHLGIKLMQQVLPIIQQSESTLIFTNTRAQCEIWYQNLLEAAPDLAGQIAMHHGSISRELRDWVEQALHDGGLKAVVCTSSLDLGVDFRPVQTIVQIGGPKGVSRFVQRAGRSGHQPGALSSIHFVPTHLLELVEAAALREAVEEGVFESRMPYIRCFDVLVQYLVTLSVSEGFREQEIFEEVLGTFCYQSMSRDEWRWILSFITTGNSLEAYNEYQKVGVDPRGVYRVMNKGIAMRHRLSIGTITSDSNLVIKYVSGRKIGTVEEWFISGLKSGDVFWFAGRSLEFVRVRDMTVQVRNSKKKNSKVPAWLGGRLPLSSQLSELLRIQVDKLARQAYDNQRELSAIEPMAALQGRRSHLPRADELLVEYFKTREGYHLVLYPFEGRFVHEGLGSLLAYRISALTPISFSIAMNDYGMELLSDKEIPVGELINADLFDTSELRADIARCINATELARRKFRDIASIAGLVFRGYPGREKRDRHLQSSSNLLFQVFDEYEPENLLYLQSHEEARTFQLEEDRLRKALKRIGSQKIVLQQPHKPTPFAFPIMVDRLRERLSSEKLKDRIEKMTLLLEKD
ncbi:MAG: ligase-associated DNA damage response DEXH box helicase [Bacteroidota bacterium]